MRFGIRESSRIPNHDRDVRFIHFYLVGYFALVIGACLALWRAGVLMRLPALWVFLSAIIVVGLGLLLAVMSALPTTTSRE